MEQLITISIFLVSGLSAGNFGDLISSDGEVELKAVPAELLHNEGE